MSEAIVTVVNQTESTLAVWLNPGWNVTGGQLATVPAGAVQGFVVDQNSTCTVSYCEYSETSPTADQVLFVPGVIPGAIVTLFTEVAMRAPSAPTPRPR